MLDVLVIGAGVGGATLTTALRARGAEVLQVAADAGGSGLALALSRPSYLPKDTIMAPSDREGAWWYPADRSKAPKWHADWRSYDPMLHGIGVPDLTQRVDLANPERGLPRARVTVLATADRGKVSWGATWIHDNPEALTSPWETRIHPWAPYRTVAALAWPHGARIGSAAAGSRDVVERQAASMLARALELGWVRLETGWRLEVGTRRQADNVLERRHDGAWSYSGWHRNGYALAPLAAGHVADRVLGSA